MPARISEAVNAFETTLAGAVDPTTTSALLTTVSGLAFPTYLVLDPEVPAKREVVYATAAIGTTITLSERYLEGSALPSGITHDAGAIVRASVAAQFVEDLHDRIDAVGQGHDDFGDDDHTQYLNTARHDTTARHQPGTSLATTAAGASAPGDSAAEGAASSFSRSDHRHSREAHGSAQHAVGTVVPAGTPGTSNPGDSPAAGVATTAARSDHVHGREAVANPATVGVRVHRNSSIGVATGTAIPFDTESVDTDGFHSTVTNTTRLTIPAGKGGRYFAFAQIRHGQFSGFTVSLHVVKNASVGQFSGPQLVMDHIGSVHVQGISEVLVPGDYLELQITHNVGGSIQVADLDSYFGMFRIGA